MFAMRWEWSNFLDRRQMATRGRTVHFYWSQWNANAWWTRATSIGVYRSPALERTFRFWPPPLFPFCPASYFSLVRKEQMCIPDTCWGCSEWKRAFFLMFASLLYSVAETFLIERPSLSSSIAIEPDETWTPVRCRSLPKYCAIKSSAIMPMFEDPQVSFCRSPGGKDNFKGKHKVLDKEERPPSKMHGKNNGDPSSS